MSTKFKLSVMTDGVLVVAEYRGDKLLRSEMYEAKVSKPTAAKLEAFLNRSRCDCKKRPRA